MKKLRVILAILLIPLCYSCGVFGCSDIACTTPPQYFYFEILDTESKENIFLSDTLNTDNISIFTTDGEHRFFDIDDYGNQPPVIVINSVGWKTEQVTLEAYFKDDLLFSFYVDAENVSEDCCNFTRFHETKVSNCTYEFDSTSWIYKVYH